MYYSYTATVGSCRAEPDVLASRSYMHIDLQIVLLQDLGAPVASNAVLVS